MFFKRNRYVITFGAAFIGGLVGLWSGLLSLVDAYVKTQTIKESIYAGGLVFIVVLLMVFLLYRELKSSRFRLLGNIAHNQKRASEHLKTLNIVLSSNLKNATVTENTAEQITAWARGLLQQILDEYCTIFSSLSRSQCRVCIKCVFEAKETMYVCSLVRDKISSEICKQSDTERTRDLLDKLDHNTDFLELFDPSCPDQGYFLKTTLLRA